MILLELIIMHNGHYHKEEYKQKQRDAYDLIHGPKKIHVKECEHCHTEFEIFARDNSKKLKIARFCSRSCANSRSASERWRQAKRVSTVHTYRRICFEHHAKQCVVCGYDEILQVHHCDHNRENNTPENLIPICPNDHELLHKGTAEQKSRVRKAIEKYMGN